MNKSEFKDIVYDIFYFLFLKEVVKGERSGKRG
jgi:hypothetical protein